MLALGSLGPAATHPLQKASLNNRGRPSRNSLQRYRHTPINSETWPELVGRRPPWLAPASWCDTARPHTPSLPRARSPPSRESPTGAHKPSLASQQTDDPRHTPSSVPGPILSISKEHLDAGVDWRVSFLLIPRAMRKGGRGCAPAAGSEGASLLRICSGVGLQLRASGAWCPPRAGCPERRPIKLIFGSEGAKCFVFALRSRPHGGGGTSTLGPARESAQTWSLPAAHREGELVGGGGCQSLSPFCSCTQPLLLGPGNFQATKYLPRWTTQTTRPRRTRSCGKPLVVSPPPPFPGPGSNSAGPKAATVGLATKRGT